MKPFFIVNAIRESPFVILCNEKIIWLSEISRGLEVKYGLA